MDVKYVGENIALRDIEERIVVHIVADIGKDSDSTGCVEVDKLTF